MTPLQTVDEYVALHLRKSKTDQQQRGVVGIALRSPPIEFAPILCRQVEFAP